MNPQLRKQIEEIVAKAITRETHKGSVNRVRFLVVDQLVSLFEKEETPMGVSQWKEYGKKYGYWEYFEKEVEKVLEEADKPHTIRSLKDATKVTNLKEILGDK